MRQMILTLFMMITVGVFAFAEGWNLHAQTTTGPHVVDLVETGQPHVVLAKNGTRQQKEARQQTEGCPVVPNEKFSQHKTNEEDSSIMKGLVF